MIAALEAECKSPDFRTACRSIMEHLEKQSLFTTIAFSPSLQRKCENCIPEPRLLSTTEKISAEETLKDSIVTRLRVEGELGGGK